VPARSSSKTWLLVVLVLLLAVVGSVSFLGWRQSAAAPRATLGAPRALGQKASLVVTVEAGRGSVATVEVRIAQGGKTATAVRREGGLGARADLAFALEPAALGFREGSATLEVWARDDYWRPFRVTERALATAQVTIDLTPPRLDILAATRYVSPGGALLVAFRAADARRVDVTVGARAFPSFPHGPAERGARVALVGLPYDFAEGTPLAVRAEDEAGNVTTRPIPAELKPRRFPHDTIQIKDDLLRAKLPELLPQRPPSQPLVEGFLIVNRDQRKQAEQEKARLGARTGTEPLWEGPFTQPRNTKVFSNFAETRTYVYEGKEIDTQVHYGYDLASTKQSPVPAANRGAVVFAGPLTIYGNTIVLDHGWGLQTLYAHLSSIEVKVGDTVDRGQELGRTGSTGFAVGDHLHFEVLVAGVSVTPLEWWDAKWLRDRIATPLREAGLPEITGLGAAEPPPARAADPSRRRDR